MDHPPAEPPTQVPPPPPPPADDPPRRPQGAPGEVLIAARRLAVMDSGRFALAELSFELREREIAALVGPGAMRLARVLLGQKKAVVGALEGVGWTGALHPVPAAFAPRSQESVVDNLALVHGAAGHPHPDQAARDTAGLFGLEAVEETKAGALEAGDRQLLTLAASLTRDNGVAVLSSPTAELDEPRRVAAELGITQLAARGTRAFFLLPASPEEAEAIATNVMWINRDVADHLTVDSFIRKHGPAARITLHVRNVDAAHRLTAVFKHLGLDEVAVDIPGRQIAASAPAGVEDLVRIIDWAKAAGLDIASYRLTGPTLGQALAAAGEESKGE